MLALALLTRLWDTVPLTDTCLTWPLFRRGHAAGVGMLCGVPDEGTRAEGLRWYRGRTGWVVEPLEAIVTIPGCLAFASLVLPRWEVCEWPE